MTLKKQSVVQIYQKTFGNVTSACKHANISRVTYYGWLKTDPEFKAAIEAVEPKEVFVDYAENALAEKIMEGDTTAIIFALKTKGKHRGWVERKEIDHSGIDLSALKVEIVNRPQDD